MRDLTTFLAESPELVQEWMRRAGEEPAFEESEPDDDVLGWLRAPALGLQVTIGRDGLVQTIHLHSHSHDGYHGFEGPLPEGLTFAMGRRSAQAALGSPSSQGGPVPLILSTQKVCWDRWLRETYSLHCEYPEDEGRIQMVTVSTREIAEPGAPPNGGPAVDSGNSGASGGPPSVS